MKSDEYIYNELKSLIRIVYNSAEKNGEEDCEEIWEQMAQILGHNINQIYRILNNLCDDFELDWIAPSIDHIVWNNQEKKDELISIFTKIYEFRKNKELKYETNILQGIRLDYHNMDI